MIKKVTNKLDFAFEAQGKCPHGTSMISDSCATDCRNYTYTNMNAAVNYGLARAGSPAVYAQNACAQTVTYSCSWSHAL